MSRPGASEADLDAAEGELGVSLPPAFRALYRAHDGQELKLDRDLDTTRTSLPHKSMFHGVLGGWVLRADCARTQLPSATSALGCAPIAGIWVLRGFSASWAGAPRPSTDHATTTHDTTRCRRAVVFLQH